MISENLPCYPCPHRSVCCRWGTFLSEQEASELAKDFGASKVFYSDDDHEWRTQTIDGRCVFFADNKCSIHSHPFYPNVCRIFPYQDGRNPLLSEAADASTCPEVKKAFNFLN